MEDKALREACRTLDDALSQEYGSGPRVEMLIEFAKRQRAAGLREAQVIAKIHRDCDYACAHSQYGQAASLIQDECEYRATELEAT